MDIFVKPLQLDRVEMSFRIGGGSVVPLQIVNDTIDFYVRSHIARPLELYPFMRGNPLARHAAISLSSLPKNTLTVATGTSSGRGSGRFQWVKFGFNPNKLLLSEAARDSFLSAMNDLLPGGGYSELLARGNVVYTEFAVDVHHANIALLDAYSSRMNLGSWIVRDEGPSTIYLNKSVNRSETAFAIYDKKRSDRETQRRVRRYPIVRIEARRRFNHNPTTRKLTVAGLPRIRNPFLGFELFDRQRIAEVFSAACHASFLEEAQRFGLQSALSTGGQMKERRIRMLQQCRVPWWDTQEAWEVVGDAAQVLRQLLE